MTKRYALREDQLERVFTHLAADADNAYAMIDATIIRAHHHAAGAKGATQRRRTAWKLN